MDDADLLQAFDSRSAGGRSACPGFHAELVDEPAPVLRMTPTGADAAWGGGVSGATSMSPPPTPRSPRRSHCSARAAASSSGSTTGTTGRPTCPTGCARPASSRNDEEALIVGEVAVVRERLAAAAQPEGITVRAARGPGGRGPRTGGGINDLSRAVWDEDDTDMHRAIAAAIAADPRGTSMWLAVADDGTVVCAARANFHRGTDFASLWGGSTLAEYRGRGIYKALVSGARTRRPSAASGSSRSTRHRTVAHPRTARAAHADLDDPVDVASPDVVSRA
jgi:hypothetical protein